MRFKAFIKENKYIMLTFGIAFAIMIFAFGILKLYPFGDRQIMVIDSWHQYYPFLQELHSKLRSGSSLFYSWNIGGGINFFLIMAYYAMSPLYLLSVFFSQAYLREFMMLITAVKIALAGTFFAIYLRGQFKRNDIFVMLFGLMYAFSAYAMGYYWDIMWLDNMALLPLIVLGFHRVFEERGFLLYTITLALAMISNFYIGYFICEFIIIYAIFTYIKSYSIRDFSTLFGKIFTVAFYSILGMGLAAITVVPTYEGINLAYATASGNPSSIKFYFTFMELFNALLANVPPSIRSGLPNINSGFLALIFMILYFASKSIPLRERIANFGLLIVFFLISTVNYLDFIFHAFHFPNEVPHRFAFMVSFLIISWAYEAFLHWEKLDRSVIWKVVVGLFAYILLTEQLNPDLDYKLVIYSSLILLALYGSVFLLKSDKKISQRVFTIVLTVIVLIQITSSAIVGTETTGSSSRDGYAPKKEDVTDTVSSLYASDTDFYRIEMLKWFSTNDPAVYGYRGISTFSSTANASMSYLNQAFGLAAAPESNRYLYASSTPVVNSIYNIKYLLSRNGWAQESNASYDFYETVGDIDVYQNKYPLSLGFMVNDAISNWSLTAKKPFKTQEEYLSAAVGYPVQIFSPMEPTTAEYTNMTETTNSDTYHTYTLKNSSQVGNVRYVYTIPKTQQTYIYLFTHLTDDVDVTIDGEKETYETRRGLVIDLGVLEAGKEVEVTFEVPKDKNSSFYISAAGFDETAYAEAYATLSDELFQVTKFSDTRIEGTIDVKDNGRFLTSIPYEPGWTATVDGVKATIIPVNSALISLELPVGTHQIVFKYTPAGFTSGAMITLISIIAVVGIALIGKKKKGIPKKRKREKNTEDRDHKEIQENVRDEENEMKDREKESDDDKPQKDSEGDAVEPKPEE
ncbi:MAG: hypothetical protein PWQ12_746 [Clostridiales bacterium]|nr:hypothetical protein [Clostridiales bacterium]